MQHPEFKLHYLQKEILKKLTLQPELKFNQLLINGLESEHMNYHLQQLIKFDLVEKLRNKYSLTDAGKDYSNSLDDEIELVEKQPKVSVILHAIRVNDKTDEIEYLLSKRLRQPYYGKIGRLGGKVRFGESLEAAARRELYEETGLNIEKLQLETIYHKLRSREDGTVVQDVIFYIFFATNFSGEMIEKTDVQENFWMSKRELESRTDLDLFDDLVLHERREPQALEFIENIAIAEGY